MDFCKDSNLCTVVPECSTTGQEKKENKLGGFTLLHQPADESGAGEEMEGGDSARPLHVQTHTHNTPQLAHPNLAPTQWILT